MTKEQVRQRIRDVADRSWVEAKFRGLFESAPDANVIVDQRGRIVLVNAQIERSFGYQRSELIGQPLELLVPHRDRERHARDRQGYFGDPRARSMGSGLELNALRKDGTEFPVDISLSPLDTEEGMLVSAAIRDISLRKQTENALKVAYQELEAFSYSVAHDLRAPLRGMSGLAQIVFEDYGDKLDAEGLDCLREIRNNAIRMGELVDALLSLARLSRREMQPERVDLAPLARAVLARAAAAEPLRAVAVVVPEHLWIWADPLLARTLLENLIGNAWKFTQHAPEARIEVGFLERDGASAVFVRDNGAGFDPAQAGRLFTPFQRLHSEKEFPGTGVGLATAQRIVHRHGGRIWAEGAPGAGAKFYFTLAGERTAGAA